MILVLETSSSVNPQALTVVLYNGTLERWKRTENFSGLVPWINHHRYYCKVAGIKTFDITDGVNLEESLSLIVQNKPRMAQAYRYQGPDHDQLFEATYDHKVMRGVMTTTLR